MFPRCATLLMWLLLTAGCAIPHQRVPEHARSAEIHRVATPDGAEIVLTRYAEAGGQPVILCHGISSNHHFWDFGPERSLAQHLHGAGFDVWNLDLRGHGYATADASGERSHTTWSVDHYGRYDLPTAIAHIRQATGRDDLAYVGHSMGGIVLAIYLASTVRPAFTSAVIVASPLDFRDPDDVIETLFHIAPRVRMHHLPTPAAAGFLAGLGALRPYAVDDYFYNGQNLSHATQRRALRRVVSPLYRGEIRQFLLAGIDGNFRSADGRTAYRHYLEHVRMPMLFLAGRADRVVHPDRVKAYYEAVGSAEKSFVVLSVANGFSGDYGHLDYGVGDAVREEVFPLITDWLKPDGEQP